MMAPGNVRETHLGVVVDNNDEEQRGRIKVACASLMGVDPETGEPIEYPRPGLRQPSYKPLSNETSRSSDENALPSPIHQLNNLLTYCPRNSRYHPNVSRSPSSSE